MAYTSKIRYASGWRLSIKPMKLTNNRLWYVIIGEKDGRKYMFSRHMSYDWAELRLDNMDPDECQHTPLMD